MAAVARWEPSTKLNELRTRANTVNHPCRHFLLACATACLWHAAVAADASSKLNDVASPAQALPFDEFIDHSMGTEVSPPRARGYEPYRARQVDKTIWRLIDRKGYYADLRKQFKAWCSAHSGSVRELDDGADCRDGTSLAHWLGAFRIEITSTATYQGEMTAGYARILFLRDEEMQAMARKTLLSDQAKAARETRQQVCAANWIAGVRANPALGTKTNLGMIIDSRPPLVQVQELGPSPTVRWVEIEKLRPLETDDYCR